METLTSSDDLDDAAATGSASSLMTTAEVAEYLRVKERTIYEMVSRQTIPFTRATGKLLFPRWLIDTWLEAQTELPQAGIAPAPPIYAGSNDPLLEWALRQSGSGLAVLASGSAHGLTELAAGRAVLAGCHLMDPEKRHLESACGAGASAWGASHPDPLGAPDAGADLRSRQSAGYHRSERRRRTRPALRAAHRCGRLANAS